MARKKKKWGSWMEDKPAKTKFKKKKWQNKTT